MTNKILISSLVTIMIISFWTFLWWIAGYDFNHRNFATLMYVVSTLMIALKTFITIYDY